MRKVAVYTARREAKQSHPCLQWTLDCRFQNCEKVHGPVGGICYHGQVGDVPWTTGPARCRAGLPGIEEHGELTQGALTGDTEQWVEPA